MHGCLSRASYWGPGTQPRHTPQPGTEPATLQFAGWHSIHWATPARARIFFLTKKRKVERRSEEGLKGRSGKGKRKFFKHKTYFWFTSPSRYSPILMLSFTVKILKRAMYTPSLLFHLPFICQPLHSSFSPHPSTKITLVKITNNYQIAKSSRHF